MSGCFFSRNEIFFCKLKDDKNSLCTYEGYLKLLLLIFFYEYIGESLWGMSEGMVTAREMAEMCLLSPEEIHFSWES